MAALCQGSGHNSVARILQKDLASEEGKVPLVDEFVKSFADGIISSFLPGRDFLVFGLLRDFYVDSDQFCIFF